MRQGLVLLDEPVTSTDPKEGAALAAALLVHLARRGLKVAATTHYSELKALAQSTPGFANASVQFDLATLSPTYRVVMGLPGGSSALDIAGRLGMDEVILEEARNRLERDDGLLERLLNDVQERQRRLSEELDRAGKARHEAEAAAESAQKIRQELQATEREQRAQLKRRLTQEFQRARAAVQTTIDEVKQQRTIEKAKEAKQRLAEMEAHVRQTMDADRPAIEVNRLAPGSEVELARLGMVGTLLESPQGKKRVRVKVGDGEVLATVAELVGRERSEHAGSLANPHQCQATSRRERDLFGRAVMNQLDVRGKTADEALELVVATLDQAMLAEEPLVRIIHGYGTGRLKTVLRDYLASSPYVARFRHGERSEGGEGVTVVELK
jgi:DNA mismatch repair protein MutS2